MFDNAVCMDALYKQLDDDLQEKVSTYFIYIAILNCNMMKMYVKFSKYNS
jgi:predicted tellurium resistance membrane protein TerC